MNLKFLAISDTHLGEDTSLLCFNRGRQEVWRALRDVIGEGSRFDIDEVILIGDITDRALSSSAQIITQTNAFVRTLGSAAHINKCVYIPGNHDHTLWSDYIDRRYGLDSKVTAPEGELLVKVANGVVQGKLDDVKDLLTIFFGYEYGTSWRGILSRKDEFSFLAANPIYATTFKDRSYVFTHGTHFRMEVSAPKWAKRIADYALVDDIFAGYDIDSDCDVSKANNLDELEDTVHNFVDTLWPSPREDNPNPRSDKLWYFLTSLSGKLSGKRETPATSNIFSWHALQNVPEKRIKRLIEKNIFQDSSLERWEKYFKKHMLSYLSKHDIPTKNLTFVYGDTHKGGWGEQTNKERNIRFYNTGGWVTHHLHEHPACHMFAVDTEGNEYLFDVSFKDATVLREPILQLAAKDAESRYTVAGKVFRFFLDLMVPD